MASSANMYTQALQRFLILAIFGLAAANITFAKWRKAISRKIEHLEASRVNKHSFSPDVETYALNILYNHYNNFFEPKTKVMIEEITKQMNENSEKALAEFEKTKNRKSAINLRKTGENR